MFGLYINSEMDLAKARKETLHGRSWIVAPMTMLKEGIYNGSGGPIFYPGKENKKSAKSWNHMPIVLNHPQNEAGQFISAKTPEVLEERGLGMVLATNGSTGALKAEAWFDEARVELVEPALLAILNAALENTPSQAVEISTGLQLIPKEEVGVWNNLTYTKVATQYEPDHLAVLMTKKGSCSTEAGCGLFVNTQAELDKFTTSKEKATAGVLAARKALLLEISDPEMIANEVSFSEIEEALRNALRDTDYIIYDNGWIEAVFVDKFIFRFRQKYYSQAYKMEGQLAKLVGTYQEVTRRVEYDPVVAEMVTNVSGTETMNKVAIIAALLTTNGSGWTEADKPQLEALDEALLKRMHENLPKATPAVVANASGAPACGCNGAAPAPAQTATTPAVVANAAAPAQAAAAQAPVTNAAQPAPAAWWEAIPSAERVLIQDALTTAKQIREGHIAVISAAPGNTLTANTLAGFSTETLAGLATLVTNAATAQKTAEAKAAEAATLAANQAQQAQNPFAGIDYRGAAGVNPTQVANAASGQQAPVRTPLKMLSTFTPAS